MLVAEDQIVRAETGGQNSVWSGLTHELRPRIVVSLNEFDFVKSTKGSIDHEVAVLDRVNRQIGAGQMGQLDLVIEFADFFRHRTFHRPGRIYPKARALSSCTTNTAWTRNGMPPESLFPDR